jgi:thiamine-monophosphate kinase
VTTGHGGEFELIARIQRRLGPVAGAAPLLRPPLEGEVFSGDDAAVLSSPAGQLLLAIDLVVDGVHLDLSLGSPSDAGWLADAGWKAVSVNASDIAAMGGRPLHVVAGISAPADMQLDAVADGMIEACAAYGIALVGGDLTAGERLVISVAITGTCDDRAAVLRSGASDGDVIWVTGPLGSSAAGLRLLQGVTMPPPARPPAAQPPASQPAANQLPAAQPAVGGEPRRVSLTEAQSRLVDAYRRPVARIADGMTAAAAGATAMIDVSDGLAQDLDHIATQSEVGVRLDTIPVAEGASPEEAFGGGEDYELVFTAAQDAPVLETFAAASLRPPVRIGICTAKTEERSLGGRQFEIRGWEHPFT